KLIEDGRMNRKLRRRHVDRAEHLLYRLAVGGKRRRVLILAAHIEGHRPRRSRHRSPAYHVGPLAIGTAVVIDEGLAKVIAVVERRAGDAAVTRIDAVDPGLGSPGALEAPEFVRELGFERRVEPVRLRWMVVFSARVVDVQVVDAQAVTGGHDDPGALHARPWP